MDFQLHCRWEGVVVRSCMWRATKLGAAITISHLPRHWSQRNIKWPTTARNHCNHLKSAQYKKAKQTNKNPPQTSSRNYIQCTMAHGTTTKRLQRFCCVAALWLSHVRMSRSKRWIGTMSRKYKSTCKYQLPPSRHGLRGGLLWPRLGGCVGFWSARFVFFHEVHKMGMVVDG